METAATIESAHRWFGDRLSLNAAIRESHAHGEANAAAHLPDAVIYPETTAEISQMLALGHANGFRFVPATITRIDGERAVILDDAPDEPFDCLVLALGSTIDSFATPGVIEHCDMLDSVGQAENLKRRLLDRAQKLQITDGNAQPAAIAIVGAGATGVELAAELRYAAQQLPAYGALRDPRHLAITIIDLADRVLPSLPADIAADTTRSLRARHRAGAGPARGPGEWPGARTGRWAYHPGTDQGLGLRRQGSRHAGELAPVPGRP